MWSTIIRLFNGFGVFINMLVSVTRPAKILFWQSLFSECKSTPSGIIIFKTLSYMCKIFISPFDWAIWWSRWFYPFTCYVVSPYKTCEKIEYVWAEQKVLLFYPSKKSSCFLFRAPSRYSLGGIWFWSEKVVSFRNSSDYVLMSVFLFFFVWSLILSLGAINYGFCYFSQVVKCLID